jgi:hypothetical protein
MDVKNEEKSGNDPENEIARHRASLSSSSDSLAGSSGLIPALTELKDEEMGAETEIGRTKSATSIAETLSLPREIAFVAIICMAQFTTRKSSKSLQTISSNCGCDLSEQRLDSDKF